MSVDTSAVLSSVSEDIYFPVIPRIFYDTFQSLPNELRDAKRWVNWKWDIRNGKLTKVPVNNINAYQISVVDPDNWLDFDEAVQNHFKSNPKIGIGFVLGGGFCGLDFDHCINDGTTDPKVKQILEGFDSYREVSPSGTGVKMIVRATLPRYFRNDQDTIGKTRNKRKEFVPGVDIEFYDRARMFTITCNGIGEIRETQDKINKLHADIFGSPESWAPVKDPNQSETETCPLEDDELIERISRSAQGEKFDSLYEDGDASEYNGDMSSADMALAGILAFWVGNDPTRIVALMRQSGLGDDRDDKYEREDYLQNTVEKAIDESNVFKSWDDERDDDDDEPSQALKELITEACEDAPNEITPEQTVPEETPNKLIFEEAPEQTPTRIPLEQSLSQEIPTNITTVGTYEETPNNISPEEAPKEPLSRWAAELAEIQAVLKATDVRTRINQWLKSPPKVNPHVSISWENYNRESFRHFPYRETLPPTLANFIEESSKTLSCDPAMIALPMLGVLGTAIAS